MKIKEPVYVHLILGKQNILNYASVGEVGIKRQEGLQTQVHYIETLPMAYLWVCSDRGVLLTVCTYMCKHSSCVQDSVNDFQRN